MAVHIPVRACERSLAAGCFEISPGGSPTWPGLQRELTSANLKLLEWTTRGEEGGAGGGSIFLERLTGWMDVEGMEGAESGEIVQRMWCGSSSLLMLEILFGYQ